jgi:hypothetical protein
MRSTSDRRNSDAQRTRSIARTAKDASNNAIRNAFAHGIAVTRMSGNDIIKMYPDGRTEIIKKIENSSVTLDKRRYHI